MDCIDISGWTLLKAISKGSRNKKWVTPRRSFKIKGDHSPLELYIFKESHRNYPSEFWSEILASEIGRLVGVETQEVRCAHMHETHGSLITFFLKIKGHELVEELKEGGDLILPLHPQYDRKKGKDHNIFYVKEVFDSLEQHVLFDGFLKQLVFDCLIGNTDRHQDNWGIIVNYEKESVRLAPAYDNTDCFGREIMAKHIDGFFENGKERLAAYVRRGRPHLRWSDDGINLQKIDHFEFLKRLAYIYPQIKTFAKQQTEFNDTDIARILDNLGAVRIKNAHYALSTKRRKLMYNILLMRRDIMKGLF